MWWVMSLVKVCVAGVGFYIFMYVIGGKEGEGSGWNRSDMIWVYLKNCDIHPHHVKKDINFFFQLLLHTLDNTIPHITRYICTGTNKRRKKNVVPIWRVVFEKCIYNLKNLLSVVLYYLFYSFWRIYCA